VNDTGAALAVNISNGVTPSIRNVGASTTTVTNSITLTVTPIEVGSEIRVYYTGTNVEMAGVESAAGTSQALALIAGEAVDIVVLCYNPPKVPVRITNKTFSVSQSLDPFQQDDRNFLNP
jgi:hypothetical protein